MEKEKYGTLEINAGGSVHYEYTKGSEHCGTLFYTFYQPIDKIYHFPAYGSYIVLSENTY